VDPLGYGTCVEEAGGPDREFSGVRLKVPVLTLQAHVTPGNPRGRVKDFLSVDSIFETRKETPLKAVG